MARSTTTTVSPGEDEDAVRGGGLRFEVRTRAAVRTAASTFLVVLIEAFIFSGGAVGFVFTSGAIVGAVDDKPAASNVTSNATQAELGGRRMERNHRAVYCCSLGFMVATLTIYLLGSATSMKPPQRIFNNVVRMVVSASVAPAIIMLCIVLYLEFVRGASVHGLVLGGLLIAGASLAFLMLNIEALRRRHTTEVSDGAARRPGVFWHVLRRDAPVFLVFAVGWLYVFAIFRLLEYVCSKTAGHESVYVLALLVKILGNKFQLKLIERNPNFALWLADLIVYWVPDETTALALSLINASIELMVRTWFFVSYVSHGAVDKYDHAATAARVSAGDDAERQRLRASANAYRARGQMRIVDGGNDMVAAAMLYDLPRTRVFGLPRGTEVRMDTVARLVLLQIVLEIAIDLYSSVLEAKGGLQKQHANYVSWWRTSYLTFAFKLLVTIATVAFVMGSRITPFS